MITIPIKHMPDHAVRQVRARNSNGCGGQHLGLAAMILGPVLVVCGACLGACWSMTSTLDVRVRQVERNDGANAARFEAIRDSLLRIEGKKAP
jgi:hypothetical protein